MIDQKRLSQAIVRPPGTSFSQGISTGKLGVPDYRHALEQHHAYCVALEKCGLTLTRLEPDEEFPDSTFVEDTTVIIRSPRSVEPSSPPTAILTNPGAASRVGEVQNMKKVISQFVMEIRSIIPPATLDGGDICEADGHFFIGISDRTNEAGAMQLADLLRSFGYSSRLVDVKNLANILHLKSGLAYLGDGRLVVIDGLADREEFLNHELLRLTAEEVYAANCVRVNDHVLIAAGYRRLERALLDLGYKPIALEMSEFQKMDGGLSCLSLRF
jgi:dimethylargininase